MLGFLYAWLWSGGNSQLRCWSRVNFSPSMMNASAQNKEQCASVLEAPPGRRRSDARELQLWLIHNVKPTPSLALLACIRSLVLPPLRSSSRLLTISQHDFLPSVTSIFLIGAHSTRQFKPKIDLNIRLYEYSSLVQLMRQIHYVPTPMNYHTHQVIMHIIIYHK